MPLDKFTMETVNELILDAILAIRRKYHKQLDKNSLCN